MSKQQISRHEIVGDDVAHPKDSPWSNAGTEREQSDRLDAYLRRRAEARAKEGRK